MIQIEFPGPSAGPARPADSRPRDAEGLSFLNVLTRGAAGLGATTPETGDAAAEKPGDAEVEITAAELELADPAAAGEARGPATGEVEVDLPTAQPDTLSSQDELLAAPGDLLATQDDRLATQDDRLATHDDLVAAAITAADPEAEVSSTFPAMPAAEAAVAPPLPPGDRAPPAAEIRTRQGDPSDVATLKAAASQPFRTSTEASVALASASSSHADGVILPGGVSIDAVAIPAGGAAPRGQGTMPTQFFLGATAQAAAPAQASSAATLSDAAQPSNDLSAGEFDLSTARALAGTRSDAAAPGAQQNPSAFALFATEGLRGDRDLPSRRSAYPARLTGEIAARVTASAAASSSAVQQVQGALDPAPISDLAAQSIARAESAEGAARQESGDEFALAPATPSGQQARAHPMLVAAAEPQRVTQQIAEAVRRSSGGSIELALSPKELGSVRMSIHATEAGTAIVMTAERDETMQLLRRHAEMLHDAFRDLGLGTLDLSFGGRDGKEGRTEPRASGAAGIDLSETADSPQQPTPRVVGGGLDLRM